jgi:BirA family biotin operon repressor/biotin-[acetyl-CoA-carboxylase] ligase
LSTVHNSNIVGKVLLDYETLPSTNSQALDLIKSNQAEEGMVISARHQTQGRGQMGTHWQSNPGENVTISVIFRPSFLAIEDQFYLNKAVSVAVHSTIAKLLPGKTVHIRWPNDIYVDHRKVAGILIQNIVQGRVIQWAVVGIGLNVLQEQFSIESKEPTSLSLEGAERVDPSSVRSGLCGELENFYRSLQRNKESLDSIYEGLLYKAGTNTLFFRPDGTQFMGSILGVSNSGALVVREGRRQHIFNIKEISY